MVGVGGGTVLNRAAVGADGGLQDWWLRLSQPVLERIDVLPTFVVCCFKKLKCKERFYIIIVAFLGITNITITTVVSD